MILSFVVFIANFCACSSIELLSFPTIKDVGCYSVWSTLRTKELEPPDEKPYDLDHQKDILVCTGKCLAKGLHFMFLRRAECRCAPANFPEYLGDPLDASYCDAKCPPPPPPEEPSSPQTKPEYPCGGNLGYSVFEIIVAVNPTQHRNLHLPKSTTVSTKTRSDEQICAIGNRSCVICQVLDRNVCAPQSLSPSFDYFPLNSPNSCAEFCGKSVSYFDLSEQSEKQRSPTRDAILLWWKAPSSGIMLPLPVCFCSNHEQNQEWPDYHGYCTSFCPKAEEYEPCGGIDETGEHIFVSVYTIEKRPACPNPGTSSTTLTTTVSTTTTTTSWSSTRSTKTPHPTTRTTSQTTSEDVTSDSTLSTVMTTVSEEGIEPTSSSSSSTSTISTITIEATSTTTIHPSPACTERCERRDKYGCEWNGTCDTISVKNCADLIPDSEGTASWFCKENGLFATRNPNISGCRSTWVKDMQERVDNIDNPETAEEVSHELVMGCNDSLTKESTDKYFGHEIKDLSSLTSQMIERVGSDLSPTQKQFEDLVNKAVEMNACLIKHNEPWKDLTMAQKAVISGQLTEGTEDILFYLTDFVTQSSYNKTFAPIEQFTAVAKTFDKKNRSQVPSIFPPKADPCQESCIKLPPGWTDLVNDTKIEIAMLSIHPGFLAEIMNDHEKYVVNEEHNKMLNGRLISLSVTSSTPDLFMRTKFKVDGVRSKSLKFHGKGVEIGFQHVAEAWGEQAYDIPRKLHPGELPKAAKSGAQCVFWNPKSLTWSQEGCKLLKTTRTETICECSHLTAFSVIMDVHRYVGKNAGLEILTLILCPLSEMALLVTILILSVVKGGIYKMRTTICKHLSFCLFLGNGMILIALDKNYFHMSDGVCMGAAMLAHYIFLCAFMWMLLEGVQLYRRVVFVFDSGKSYMKQFGILAYGAPVVIIAITAAIAHLNQTVPYGGETYCWLIGNYIWAFMGPVAVVITTNLVVLFIALKTAYQLQHQGRRDKCSLGGIKEKLSFYRMYFRGCFSLTVIMGITWTVGFFTLMEGSVKLAAAYLFTILNASQGFFIFTFTCRTYLGNVRLYTRRKLSSLFPSLLNSSSNPGSMRKPHIISRGKLEFPSEHNYEYPIN